MHLPTFSQYFGVDFSGARQAGRNIWVAQLVPGRRPPFRLVALDRLEALAGTAEREPALAFLVDLVTSSTSALWGFDFPFGLPVELFDPPIRWADQFAFLADYDDEAYACGLECVRRARELSVAHHRTALHCRRVTDVLAKAPFDTFHYRIIYQTFFGMRLVVDPLRRSAGTAVLPFQYRKLATAERVAVECCPSSVLKRLGLPHNNYKQPTGGPLTRKRRLTRHVILDGLAKYVRVGDRERRVAMRNPGGDALDAIIAGVGAALAVPAANHHAIARHPRFKREGHLYV